MTIELNLANLIFIVISLICAFWALLKIIARQGKRYFEGRFETHEKANAAHYLQINSRLDALDSAAKADVGQWQRVERELLNLKADLPLHYVRREDYIRGQSVIEAKLDALGIKLENVQLRTVNDAINTRRNAP